MTPPEAHAISAGNSGGRLRRALARRAGTRFFRFFVREISPHTSDQRPPAVGFEILSERAVLEVCNDPELDLRTRAVSQAHARGDLCVGAFHNEMLVGYCWLAFSPLPHLDGVWVRFAPSTAWLYKSFVRPSHRGRGIAPALYAYGDEACAKRKRRHSVICVESHNQPSVKAALRAEYRSSGYGGYVLRAMPVLTWCAPAAKRQGVAFFLPTAS